jgi:hypothetical protein
VVLVVVNGVPADPATYTCKWLRTGTPEMGIASQWDYWPEVEFWCCPQATYRVAVQFATPLRMSASVHIYVLWADGSRFL